MINGHTGWFSLKFSSLFVMLCSFFTLFAVDWAQIGLSNYVITEVVAIKNQMHNLSQPIDSMVIVGTENNGTWYCNQNTGTFKPLGDTLLFQGPPINSKFGPINRLYYCERSSRLFAACWNDFAFINLHPDSVHEWRTVDNNSKMSIVDINGSGDTLFCCGGQSIYKSYNGGVTWDRCNYSYIGIPQFISLSFFDGVCFAGKSPNGIPISAWWGVLHSSDFGTTWMNRYDRPLFGVYLLYSYYPSAGEPERLLVFTYKGLKYIDSSFSSDTLHAFTSPIDTLFPGFGSKRCFVTYHGTSLSSRIFVVALGELFMLDDNGAWLAITLPANVNNAWDITTFNQKDPIGYYVATNRGVWFYRPDNTNAMPRRPTPTIAKSSSGTAAIFTLNGRRIPLSEQSLKNGVVILKHSGSDALSKQLILPSVD